MNEAQRPAGWASGQAGIRFRAPNGADLPPEPPIGSVIKFQLNLGGKLYTYASLRADNGLWYTTGGGSKQNATWGELVEGISGALAGPVMALTGGTGLSGVLLWRA